ncbi:MBOAT family protein [Algoriphagus lacus]|uniref:MBOAT family protein n=1 Tax=Algoriphagus lacus TaxID=2056311 RepID=A0A418PWB3_9BACT|nr:MBOAT family O-acyltransferase [Algoriphagus lacus]RIW18346.1 MBOAT family protein [Algoriphagus lacus]
MLFNSIEFAIFLPIVFALYWLFNKYHRVQLWILLLASYLFYGWWDWRFLGLIALSSFIDFFIGIGLGQTDDPKRRKLLLGASLVANLGLLGFFKYFNFFTEAFVDAFSLFGMSLEKSRLDIILPVGISFYTFQTLSYTFDVYKKQLTPTKDVLAFLGFVSFFPQLVAGPIERASHLLGQFYTPRKFNYSLAVSGVRLIVWGLFKKVVIADNAAILVDEIFTNYQDQNSLSLILGSVLFALQIYGDFSGYSDIAIGLSRMFGFDLMMNFRFPYLAQNINDFWKRWHISLSTWFRDYVYIPLGGSRGSIAFSVRNVMIIFLVSGFWHGANWNFLAWGAIHGLMYVPFFINKAHQNLHQDSFWLKLPRIFLTFSVVCLAWVFFRADSLGQALDYLGHIWSNEGAGNFIFSQTKRTIIFAVVAFFSLFMLGTEAFFENKQKSEVLLPSKYLLILALSIIFFGAFKNHESFIYFQF